MARIVFETDITASPAELLEALNTADGIAAWWTDDVSFDQGTGTTIEVGFPVAPMPFQLRVESAGEEAVVWRSTGEFPPHWVDTTVTWTLTPSDDSTKVHFEHDGWESDEGPLPAAAYTWGQLLVRLKDHAESGTVAPLFTRM